MASDGKRRREAARQRRNRPMTGAVERNGILIVLSSPSGAGKSTMTRRLLEAHPDIRLSVSATTRPPRPGETEGHDYFFVTHERFAQMVDGGELLEHADVFGHRYGTPRGAVEASLGGGHDMIFDVDWQGAQQLRLSAIGRSVVSIFLLPPSIGALEARLRARGQDSDEVIAGRMAKARAEISHWAEYDYVLINDDLDRCYAQIETIVSAERLRLRRQRGMRAVVERLNHDFDASQGGR